MTNAIFETPVTNTYALFDWQYEELQEQVALLMSKYPNYRDFRIHATDCAWFLSQQARYYDPYCEGADYSQEAFLAIQDFFDEFSV